MFDSNETGCNSEVKILWSFVIVLNHNTFQQKESLEGGKK